MKAKSKTREAEIKHLLEESKAENDALKKLIEALATDEMSAKNVKHNSAEPTKPPTK